MKKMKKLSEFDKNYKIFRICNILITLISTLVCVGLGIYNIVIGDPNNRLVACFGVAIVPLLPIVVELIIRARFSNLFFLAFQIYFILAGVIGCAFNMYNLLSWYDTLIHTLAGYTFALLGVIVLSRLDDYKKLSPWTIIVFCVVFSLAIELIWELMEWFADSCLGQTAQGHPPVGEKYPSVLDTEIGRASCRERV